MSGTARTGDPWTPDFQIKDQFSSFKQRHNGNDETLKSTFKKKKEKKLKI